MLGDHFDKEVVGTEADRSLCMLIQVPDHVLPVRL